MYEMSYCIFLFLRYYFEIFMGGDVFVGDLFYREIIRSSGKGGFLIYFFIFMFFIK